MYSQEVEKGYIKMQQCSVAICALVRDCEEPLERNIPLVNTLRDKFSESNVVMIENDSIDNTKAILQNMVLRER
ncbi:MAG: hypothetical protein HRU20_12720 [Pseudomonadales bacterium]|nr:hypothetical protein [Pseudomonadales bacterium]